MYLWNAGTGQIEQLLTLEGSETVCSVGWVQGGGSHLAVGTSSATVELWDCEKIKRLRVSLFLLCQLFTCLQILKCFFSRLLSKLDDRFYRQAKGILHIWMILINVCQLFINFDF